MDSSSLSFDTTFDSSFKTKFLSIARNNDSGKQFVFKLSIIMSVSEEKFFIRADLVHKNNHPLRPICSSVNAKNYKLASEFASII